MLFYISLEKSAFGQFFGKFVRNGLRTNLGNAGSSVTEESFLEFALAKVKKDLNLSEPLVALRNNDTPPSRTGGGKAWNLAVVEAMLEFLKSNDRIAEKFRGVHMQNLGVYFGEGCIAYFGDKDTSAQPPKAPSDARAPRLGKKAAIEHKATLCPGIDLKITTRKRSVAK